MPRQQMELFEIARQARQQRMNNLARWTDPVTSRWSATEMKESGAVGQMQRLALHLIKSNPGRTAKELEQIRSLHDGQVRKRLAEMERKHMIRRGEPRRCKVTGRRATTWWIA